VDRRIYDRSDVLRLLAHLVEVLEALAENPRARLGDLPEVELSERKPEMSKHSFGGSSSFSKFKSVAPKAVDLSQAARVDRGFLSADERMPVVLTAASEDVDLVEWAAAHRSEIEDDLRRHGAILLRGFG